MLKFDLGRQLRSAVIDTVQGFAYFGTSLGTIPSSVGNKIIKIRLADFTVSGILPLELADGNSARAVIDIAGGFAYFGTVKVRLSDFSRVGRLNFRSDTFYFEPPVVVDSINRYLYFGGYNVIVKFDVLDSASLSLTNSAPPIAPNMGLTLPYTLTLTNDSPVTATNVILTHTSSVSITLGGVTSNVACNTISTKQIVCNWASLSANATAQAMVQMSVPLGYRGLVTSTTSATANEPRFSNGNLLNSSVLVNPLQRFLPLVER